MILQHLALQVSVVVLVASLMVPIFLCRQLYSQKTAEVF